MSTMPDPTADPLQNTATIDPVLIDCHRLALSVIEMRTLRALVAGRPVKKIPGAFFRRYLVERDGAVTELARAVAA